ILIFNPYKTVARKIQRVYSTFSKLMPFLAASVSNVKPAKPIMTPIIFLRSIFDLKKSRPVMTTQMGVKEFKIPARLLSMFFAIAPAKRYAGNRFPQIAEKITSSIFLLGILEK